MLMKINNDNVPRVYGYKMKSIFSKESQPNYNLSWWSSSWKLIIKEGYSSLLPGSPDLVLPSFVEWCHLKH